MGYFLIWLPNGRPKSPAFHALPSDFFGISQFKFVNESKTIYFRERNPESNLGKIFSDEEIS